MVKTDFLGLSEAAPHDESARFKLRDAVLEAAGEILDVGIRGDVSELTIVAKALDAAQTATKDC